jgi:hypothetical protein
MASLTEHVMINKLGDDLDEAITFAGGDTSAVSHINQYPQVIREQLRAGGILENEILLEGDSCIIRSDENGWDVYNTKYASGKKTGLNPGTLYIRICTAVSGVEPVYIDATPILQDIDERLIVVQNTVNEVSERVVKLEEDNEEDQDQEESNKVINEEYEEEN